MSANDGARIARKRYSRSAHTACSRAEPHPKFAPVRRIVAPSASGWLSSNSGFKLPSGRNRQSEKRADPKPVRSTRFRNCLGMIWSVSTSARGSAATAPVWPTKGSITTRRTPPPAPTPIRARRRAGRRPQPPRPSAGSSDGCDRRAPGVLRSCGSTWRRSAPRTGGYRRSSPGTSSTRRCAIRTPPHGTPGPAPRARPGPGPAAIPGPPTPARPRLRAGPAPRGRRRAGPRSARWCRSPETPDRSAGPRATYRERAPCTRARRRPRLAHPPTGQRTDRVSGVLDDVPGRAGGPDATDQGEDEILGRDAREGCTGDARLHRPRLGPYEALGRQHVLDLARADPEGQRPEGSVRRCVRVAAHDDHPRLGETQLGADHVHDALVGRLQIEQLHSEVARVLG